MKEARVEELLQVADHPDVNKVPDVVRGGLRELLAVEPLRRDHLAPGILCVRGGHHNLGKVILDARRELGGVIALLDVVQLLEEPLRPLVQQTHDVGVDLRHRAKRDAHAPQDVEVHRHRLQHRGPLHLDRHDVAVALQLALVHLPEARRRHRVGSKLAVHFLPLAPEFPLQGVKRDLVIEGRNLVAQFLQLRHRLGGEDVGADAERLAELDVRRAEGCDDLPELNRALHRVLARLFRHEVHHDAGDERPGDGGELDDALRHGAGPAPPVLRDELGIVVQRQLVVVAALRLDAFQVDDAHLHAVGGEVAVVDVGAAKARHEGVEVLVLLHLRPDVLDLAGHLGSRGGPLGAGHACVHRPAAAHATSAHSLPRRKSSPRLPKGARGCRAADGRRRRDREGGGHLLCSRLTPLTPLSTL